MRNESVRYAEWDIRLLWSSRDTHTCCRAFSSGAVTSCFNDLGLWRLGFEQPTFRLRGFEQPTFRLRGERSYRLRHRRGKDVIMIIDKEK